jgi:HD-GYP domain-containing protein (c-di-GMP phosphodiesterase class II)
MNYWTITCTDWFWTTWYIPLISYFVGFRWWGVVTVVDIVENRITSEQGVGGDIMADQEIERETLGNAQPENVFNTHRVIMDPKWGEDEDSPGNQDEIEEQTKPGTKPVRENAVKRKIRSVRSSINERKTLQSELIDFPTILDEKEEQVFTALNNYRVYLVSLSFKAHKVDHEIWELYERLQIQTAKVRRETKLRLINFMSNATLRQRWQAWKEVITEHDRLLDKVSNAPNSHDFYNKMLTFQEIRHKERLTLEQSKKKIAEARSSLEIAIKEIDNLHRSGDEITYGSKILTLNEAQINWNQRLQEFYQVDKYHIVRVDEILPRIKKLESAIRDAPVLARWVRTIEDQYSRLASLHDILESYGKSIIPQKELARTAVILHEKIPQNWTSGDRDELERNLNTLEGFISYYQDKVEAEIATAERRRPGLTRALTMPYQEQSSNLGDIILVAQSLVGAIDARDRFMRNHSRKVTQISLEIGRRMGKNESELEYLELAALLHDVGKLSIPEVILTKTDPLTQDDWKIIQKHPFYGAQIIKPISPLNAIIPWIYHHQERWDGGGYPERLAKNSIPLEASIIAVAEAFTAMITEMPNKSALTQGEAVQKILEESEKQFNPEVVEVFQDVVKPQPIS